jgi:hypothetical protein
MDVGHEEQLAGLPLEDGHCIAAGRRNAPGGCSRAAGYTSASATCAGSPPCMQPVPCHACTVAVVGSAESSMSSSLHSSATPDRRRATGSLDVALPDLQHDDGGAGPAVNLRKQAILREPIPDYAPGAAAVGLDSARQPTPDRKATHVPGKFVLRKSSAGYHFNLLARNGRVIATSEGLRLAAGRTGRHQVGPDERARCGAGRGS